MTPKIKLHGKALHSAAKGDVIEIEIDLGIANAEFITALPDEPAHVALIRLERENELTAKLNAASVSLQRERKRSELLERELSAVTGQDSQFIQQLAGEITDRLLSSLARLSTYRED